MSPVQRSDRGWFSVVNALPRISVSAERAARAIVAAARDGRAELVMPLSAKLLVLASGAPPRALTALSDRAALRNNELAPRPL